MDALSILRTLGALAFVLGLLIGALWLVRRYELRIPAEILPRLGARLGRPAHEKRLEVVERIALDPRRSLVLVRRDNVEFSLVLAPEGLLLLEGGKDGPALDSNAHAALAPEEANLA